jgi:MSHA biogenesis protein MshG
MRHIWTYTARDDHGILHKGEVESESREQVLAALSGQGLIPINVKAALEKTSIRSILGNFGSANREKLILFTRQLRTLHRAGIPLMRALTCIARGADKIDMQAEVEGIRESLHAGLPLSRALSQYPQKFPPIYVASIAAGEASGTLDEVLSQLAMLIEKEMILARQLKSAFRYPLMVIGAIMLAIFVLMSFVIPRFAGIYGKFGADLPTPTKIVIGASHLFSSYWFVILALFILALVLLRKILSTPGGRLWWDEQMLRIPILGDLAIKANIARFSAMLSILYRAGLPMVACLNILRDTAANKVIGAEIGRLSESFEKGQEIGPDPDAYRFLPAMALEMFQIGLESGSVETIMKELAEHFESELDYKSRHLTALLEPILTVIIGGLVLLLALSVFLPMWNLIKIFR